MEGFLLSIPMAGSIVNAFSVVVGSLIGLAVRSRLPMRYSNIAFQAIGLFTLYLGVQMASSTRNVLILIFSLVVGSILGEFLTLEERINGAAEGLKRRLNVGESSFVEGFMTAFLLFCMGSMTILGAFEEGLGGYPRLLFAKSFLDGVSSIALSASLGVGVIFSAVPLLVYQGGLTLFAHALRALLSEAVVAEITAAGGIMLLGLGLSILEVKRLRVTNMLPSLLVAALLGLALLN